MSAAQAYLIDTNVLVWLSSDLGRIPKAVLDTLSDQSSALYVSTASYWELTIKQSLGKLDAAIRVDRLSSTHGFRELTITSAYMDALRQLPLLHADPFDRMLVAQAMVESLVLVTGDRRLGQYPVGVLMV